MTPHAFTLGYAHLHALPSGALFWPDQSLLAVADLHFGKSDRLARRGGSLLPPYETHETLTRLAIDLDTTHARRVICLGDSFDDGLAAETLDDTCLTNLARIMMGRDWVWISGNHDPRSPGLGGRAVFDLQIDALTFRHVATQNSLEISGHYHPKARLAGRARPCFLIDPKRVILPAFGTYTGGLWSDDPAFDQLFGADAIAVLTGTTARAIPMPRGQIKPRISSFSR